MNTWETEKLSQQLGIWGQRAKNLGYGSRGEKNEGHDKWVSLIPPPPLSTPRCVRPGDPGIHNESMNQSSIKLGNI